MKRTHPDGSFHQTLHCVYDTLTGKQLTTWDPRKDWVLSRFWRTGPGQQFRRQVEKGERPNNPKRFELRTKAFFTPARKAA